MSNIQLLDCTLRDGAYIVDGNFSDTIGGIIKRLQDAHVNLIEVGWLKDAVNKDGSTYYNVPSDLCKYLLTGKSRHYSYLAMIDYNRYDLSRLPQCDRESIDAIRVVFPHGKADEGCALVKVIKDKGYQVYLQAANTLAYSDYDLLKLAEKVNRVKPVGISIVDTFGAMFPEDLDRIYAILDNNLDKNIKLGFHSHNNMQMSYALCMQFAGKLNSNYGRDLILDGSLCGMGRGAGNAPTELVSNYLNRVFHTDYDLNIILDTIDVYMSEFQKKYTWGYSMPYFVAGMYQCHVNNVSYLSDTHAVRSKDMKMVFSSMTQGERRQYDYNLLEAKYQAYANNEVNDQYAIDVLKDAFEGRNILAVLPGQTSDDLNAEVVSYGTENSCIIVGINSAVGGYDYDYLFFTSHKKYEYAKENNLDAFGKCKKILTSNIKDIENDDIFIINYNNLQKIEWKYYDNAFLMFLRLMRRLDILSISIAGFDGYKNNHGKQYSKKVIKNRLSIAEVNQLHEEIEDMMKDFVKTNNKRFEIKFITPSPFEAVVLGNQGV